MYHIPILLSLSLFIGDLSAEENRVLFKFEEVTEMRPLASRERRRHGRAFHRQTSTKPTIRL